jgi:hypothetical protein
MSSASRRNRLSPSPTTFTPIDDTEYEPVDEAGEVDPDSVVVSTSNPNLNILASTPRYPALTGNSPRTASSAIKVETVPNLYTPKPGLLTPVVSVKKEQKVSFEEKNPVEVYLGDKFQEDNVVENELMKCGYVVVNKINTNEGGVKQCSFIRCYNKLGQPLMVKLNEMGFVLESNKDLTMIKSSTGFSRNYSLRIGEAECAKMTGCNLGFVCTDGVCILESDENGDMVEQNFEFVKKFAEREVVIDDDAVAIPIVHLSDIRANNMLVIRKVNEMTKKIRNNAFAFAMKSLSDTKDKFKAAGDNFNNYLRIEKNQENRLMQSIKILEGYSCSYEKKKIECSSGLAAIEMEKHKEVISNLALRSSKVSELLKSIRAVTMIKKQLDSINLELTSASEFLKQEFQHIGMAYDL